MTDRISSVLVCPTAFKGTLSASEAAAAMARGIRGAFPDADIDAVPLSDGGPGLVEALLSTHGGRVSHWEVEGPCGDTVTGRCLWLDDGRAVIESADACGLHLIEGVGDPLTVHTRGVGELVARALEEGARRVILGLGGSGTTDGGTGLGRAFGYQFLDAAGRPLPPGGGPLRRLARIHPGIRPVSDVLVLADVEHPLTGCAGAARVFSPQKGASREEVDVLAEGLERLEACLRRDLDVDVSDLRGAGAAGGLGAGCAAFLGAQIVGGSAWVLRAVAFDRRLEEADLVVTGEGAYDTTSGEGKIAGEVLARAAGAGVPVLLACGSVEGEPRAAGVVDGGGTVLDADGLADRVRDAFRSLAL